MKLASASDMQQLDRKAIEQFGIPGIVLMENAGRGTVEFMLRELGSPSGKPVIIFVGPGNNGGDGLVIARKLHQLGALPHIIYLVDPAELKGDAAANCNAAQKSRIPFSILHKEDKLQSLEKDLLSLGTKQHPWAIVDAVFGTGLRRELTGHYLAAVDCINRLKKSTNSPVVAVDMPSGLNGDTGIVLGGTVEADFTVTYGLAKPGHFIHGGEHCGKLHVVDIGIPKVAVEDAGLKGATIERDIIASLAARPITSHKGKFGHLLILAGSAGKSGAAFLCGTGALRVGSGLVTMAVPADLRTVFESNLYEAMTLLLPESRRHASIKDLPLIMKHIDGYSALTMGPGLGTDDATQQLVRELYQKVELPMVLDADACNILAMDIGCIADPPAPRILTPHPGEMGRLAGSKAKDIQADRLKAALDFTSSANRKAKNVTTVLKGAGTVVCDPEGTWAINTSGNPGMATGGMGDVLAGMIGGILAQGLEPGIAARAGVFIHGIAADKLAQQRKFGYLATEVADMVPFVITDCIPHQ